MTLEQLRDALSQKITSPDQLKSLNISVLSVLNKLPQGYRTLADIQASYGYIPVPAEGKAHLVGSQVFTHRGEAVSPSLEHNWWLVREWLRMMVGVYPEPSEAMRTLAHKHLAQYALHISKDDPNMVAFTASPDDGRNDRQVRMAFGKWLRKFCWFMTDAHIQNLEAQHRADLNNELELLPGSDIRSTYLSCHGAGLRSCMTHSSKELSLHASTHPVDAYNAPGFHLAVIRDTSGSITARCIVWHNPDDPADKRAVRVYGDAILTRRLQRNGYRFRDFDGAKLAVVPAKMEDGRLYDEVYPYPGCEWVCVPYLDGVGGNRTTTDASRIVHMGDHLLITTPRHAERLQELARLSPGDGSERTVYACRTAEARLQISVFKPEWKTYTCALTGETVDTLDNPPTQFLRDGQLVKVKTLKGVNLAATIHEGVWYPTEAGTQATFEHEAPLYFGDYKTSTLIDTDENRAAAGFSRLWAKHYPDAQWMKAANNLAAVRDLDTGHTHLALAEDSVMLIRQTHHSAGAYRIHKADLPEDAVRVADFDGQKTWAAPGVRVVRTDSGRKVVPYVHDVTQLDNGQWTYNRNVERTTVVYSRVVAVHHKNEVPEGGLRLWEYMCNEIEDSSHVDPRLIVGQTMVRLRGTLRLDENIGRITRAERTHVPERHASTMELALRIHRMTPEQLTAEFPATAQQDIRYILALARDYATCAEFLETLAQCSDIDASLKADRTLAMLYTGGYVATTGADRAVLRVRSDYSPSAHHISVTLPDGYSSAAMPAENLVPTVPGLPNFDPSVAPAVEAVEAPATADEQFALVA